MVDYVIIQGSPEQEQKMEWIATDGKAEDGIGRGGRKGRGRNWMPRTERRKMGLNLRRVHSPMLASQQTNDERSESRADTPQLAAGSFIPEKKTDGRKADLGMQSMKPGNLK